MHNNKRYAGLAFAVFGIVVLVLSQQIHILSKLNEPGPKLFPSIAGAGITICGLGIFFTDKAEDDKEFLTKKGWMRVLKMAAVLILYALGLSYLGFVISTPIAVMAFIFVLGEGKKISIPVSVIIAVATTAILYFVFNYAFKIYLPAGKLF